MTTCVSANVLFGMLGCSKSSSTSERNQRSHMHVRMWHVTPHTFHNRRWFNFGSRTRIDAGWSDLCKSCGSFGKQACHASLLLADASRPRPVAVTLCAHVSGHSLVLENEGSSSFLHDHVTPSHSPPFKQTLMSCGASGKLQRFFASKPERQRFVMCVYHDVLFSC